MTAVVVMVAGWIAKWKWSTDEKIAKLELHLSENYVKKADMASLKDDFAEEITKSEGRTSEQLRELKDTTGQILDTLLGQKIGTTGRRRR